MDWKDALVAHSQGFTVRFEVVPGSSRLLVPSGFNPWRKALEARLTEEPSRGKANRQLVEELASILGVPERDVEVVSGHKSRRKVLVVRGMKPEEAILKLRPTMAVLTEKGG